MLGKKSSSAELSEPFIFKIIPSDDISDKSLPESANRVYILETLTKLKQKENFIQNNMNYYLSGAQKNPRQDLEKIKAVTQFVESQPWYTEGVLLRLKNSKVEDIHLNYGLNSAVTAPQKIIVDQGWVFKTRGT